jgi:hypothetical protein
MKYIEIQEGICVNVAKIEGIEEVDKFSCKVYIGTRVYLSTFPYATLLEMLKQENIVDKASKEGQSERTMKKLDAVLSNSGYFAG